ncbi:hypothetical protein BKA69DRAFT_276665 [Paraphysoderma sedebokerense]|nr:hypothetical protein BKA69DRAFT_276665 [Paraphysoderma sedebokerense]
MGSGFSIPVEILNLFQPAPGQQFWQAALEACFGFANFLFWSFQMLPQLIHTYRRKSARGFNPHIVTIWMLSCSSTVAYSYYQRLSRFIIIQPMVFTALSTACLAQYFHYRRSVNGSTLKTIVRMANMLTYHISGCHRKYSLFQTTLLYLFSLLFFTSLILSEYAGMQYAETQLVVTIIGIAAPVFTVLGYIPQYCTIIKIKSTEGLSMKFVAMDLLGSLAFFLSLIFRPGQIDLVATAIALSPALCQVFMLFFWCGYRNSSGKVSRKEEKHITLKSQEIL